MARILRGEVYWANLDPTKVREQSGLRPVLVLSQDVFNDRSGVIIAVALTSQPQKAGFPLTLPLSSPALPKRSSVKISPIRTMHQKQLGKKITKISPEEIDLVIEGLNEIIGS